MRIDVNARFLAARPTGVQRVAGELVRRLVARPDVEAILRTPRGVQPPAYVGAAAVAPGRLAGPAWELLELPWRRERSRTADAGPVVALDPANAGPPACSIPRVLLLHDVLPLTRPGAYGPAFRLWFRTVVATAARDADRVATFSEWSRVEAVRVLGLDAGRVVVLSQGTAPFDAPPPPGEVEATLSRLGLEPGYALALGGGDPRKNTAFLEDVFRLWRSRSSRAVRLVVVGEPYRHVHRRTADDAVPDMLRTGFVSDATLRALYAGASVFCFPSAAEGFGRPPLEAMACGTPAVVGDYGCAREVLADAAIILPLDADAWVETLDDLAGEPPEARERRIAAGRVRAAHFDWDRGVDGLVSACLDAHDGARPSRVGTA